MALHEERIPIIDSKAELMETTSRSSPGVSGLTFPDRAGNLKQHVFEVAGRIAPSCDIEEMIIVAGTGRSGTTWMAEVLRGLQGYKYLNEPFMNTPLRKRTYLGPDERAPESLTRYVHRALKGRLWRTWKWRFESDKAPEMLCEFVSRTRVIAKFTRALRMVRWMSNCFDVRGTVLLIRHPCAVISSMLRHEIGWQGSHWCGMGESTSDRVFGRNLPEDIRRRFKDKVSTANRREEVLAHLWALDYYVALLGEKSSFQPYTLVPYERLLRRREDALNVSLTEAARQRLGVESFSASGDVETAEVEKQLSKWRDHLSNEQIERILSVVHLYGLDFYTKEALEPDYSRLNAAQDPSFSWGD